MPRKKKSSLEDAKLVANYIFKIMTKGSKEAKADVICKLIIDGQVEFLEQIKLTIGDKEYNRVVEIC